MGVRITDGSPGGGLGHAGLFGELCCYSEFRSAYGHPSSTTVCENSQ